MNTPSHSILNLAILRRGQSPALTWPVLVGSWLPDAALFVFYGWAKGVGLPDSVIWQQTYYEPVWQDVFAVGNSIPLALAGWGLAARFKWPWGAALFASALLHHAADLPLHHEDAHRHFWPISDVRFVSPVSYWDPDHFGAYGALGELLLVIAASLLLWSRVRSPVGKGLLALTNLLYLAGYLRFYWPLLT